MKQLFFLVAAGALAFASCQSAPEADKAEAKEAQTISTPATGSAYKVDLAQSRLEWTGTKPVGKHHGTFMLKDGSIMADKSNITGGKFTVDIKTLKADDQDSTGNAKLAGHLTSPDFFDAEKFPESTFEITSVKAGADSAATGGEVIMKDATHTITGNLTLKGVTKSITFPAKVAMNDAQITTDANFNIDRTQWGMSYGSDKSLQDKFIRPEVNIQLHIVAAK
jgi:polyisoprenoid-binding protein YceI